MTGAGPSTTTLTAAMDAAAEEVEGMEYRAALRGSYRGVGCEGGTQEVGGERRKKDRAARDGGGKNLAYLNTTKT